MEAQLKHKNKNKSKRGQEGRREGDDVLTSEENSGFLQPQVTTTSDGNETDCSFISFSSQTSARTDTSRLRKRMGSSNDISTSKKGKYLKNKSGDEERDTEPSVVPKSTRSKAKLPKVHDLANEMQKQPTSDLGACIEKQLSVVENIADTSRNLKGDYVRNLRIAVRTMQAAASELTQRTSTDENVRRLERENSELRGQMAEFSTKIDKLTEELSALRRQGTIRLGTKSAGSVSVTNEVDWEERYMERMSALMDEKLAKFKAELKPTTLQDKKESSKEIGDPKRTGKVKGNINRPNVAAPAETVQAVQTQQAMASDSSSSWATVVSRKTKKTPPKEKVSHRSGEVKSNTKKVKPARISRSAVIAVTIPSGSDVTYATVMATAKEKISLEECGIDAIRPKRAITGGLILELSGTDCTSKADQLAGRMRDSLADLGARISRPVKMGEMRIMDLDDAVTSEEVAVAVAKAGECSATDIKVGEIRRTATTLGTAWVKCPLTAVHKIAAAKHILVGWVSARIQILATRPLQCFRCLESGHVRSMCTSTVDRSTRCYNCGETDHPAKLCNRSVKCPLCADLGRPADHRMGTKKCTPPKTKKRNTKSPSVGQADEKEVTPVPESHRPIENPPEELMEAT